MNRYLKTLYSKNESGENDYPQIFCNYIYDKYIKKHEGRKLLDIGFGKANHLTAFSRLGLEVFGIDKNISNFNVLIRNIRKFSFSLNQNWKTYNIKSCDLEKESIPFDDNCFDIIFSKSLLEHIVNMDNVLVESLRVLKPNGLAIFLVPDFKSQYKDFWDDYTHIHPFTKKSLRNALLISGFRDVECEYFFQLPLVWKYPWLRHFIKIVNLFPNSFKWKNREETLHRQWVRFAKEKMLLAIAIK